MTRSLRALFPSIAEQLPAVDVSGFAIDSRAVVPGGVFVALRGQKTHGVAFAPQAVSRGAACILAEAPIPDVPALTLDVPLVVVDNLRPELGDALARFHGNTSGHPVLTGVTGTNGKTSTVQLLAGALQYLGKSAATIGTLGAGLVGHLEAGERTTPDVVATHALVAALRDQGADQIAMEVSSHALDQHRVAGLAFDYAAFSNLTRDHLDYHGDMASYGAAKASLFRWPGLKAAVINVDDTFGRDLVQTVDPSVRVLSVSSVSSAALTASHIVTDASGLTFTLAHAGDAVRVATRLIGRFNVDNLLLVAGLLIVQGHPLHLIAEALGHSVPVPGRMNRVAAGAGKALVVVDYAHTPDGLEKALVTLRDHCAGRLIVVFGCGGDRDPGKRATMGALAAQLADDLVITDDNPRTENGDLIVAAIAAGASAAKSVRIERDRARAIAFAIGRAGTGDIVLIAGKGHEPYQEIGDRKLPFDDRVVAEQILREAA